MKKTFSILLVLALVVAFAAPVAQARDFSNPEKNIGNFFSAPFLILSKPFVAVGEIIQGKPAKALTALRDIRRETVDGVESFVRIPFAPAIAKADGEMGAANTVVADANLDWLVDAGFYGGLVGPLVWNGAGVMNHTALQQAWIAAGATAAGVALVDVGGAAVEASQK